MIANELHFTNPISLILGSSILGADLKRAKFVQFVENDRFLIDSNRNANKTTLISSQVAEALGIDFEVIKFGFITEVVREPFLSVVVEG